jgi:hypothetical protein
LFSSKAGVVHREEENQVAKRKCPLLHSRGFYSSQKMKVAIFLFFYCMFFFLEEESQKYVIFIFMLTQQSFSKSLPEVNWFSYLLCPCFKLRMSASL